MRWRRWRTAMLWIGSTLCVLIVAAFVVSGWLRMVIQVPSPYGPRVILWGGAIALAFFRRSGGGEVTPHVAGFWLLNSWDATARFVECPLYALFLAVAIPTLLVWRFVPRPVKPGHCRRCGYNLRALTEARCPECGTGF